MFVSWTTKERAVKWFPLLDDEQIKHTLALMEGLLPFPRGIKESKRLVLLERINAIGVYLDMPPDILEDSEQALLFLKTLRSMMIEQRRLAKLQLGMYVNVHGRIGVVIHRDFQRLSVVVLFGNFWHESKSVNIEDIKRLPGKFQNNFP